MEEFATHGFPLDVSNDDHPGTFCAVNLQRDEAALTGLGQGVFELRDLDLEGGGFNIVPIEVGRDEPLASQKPDLLAQYIPAGGYQFYPIHFSPGTYYNKTRRQKQASRLLSTAVSRFAYNLYRMKTSDFDYHLPPELIAQTAAEPRDHSRLMVLSRRDGAVEHCRFYELCDYLHAGDLVVCNDSRVIPARLLGSKVDSAVKVELLLLRRLDRGVWETLVRPGRRLKTGARIEVGAGSAIQAEVIAKTGTGTAVVSFSDEESLEKLGAVPLPPYIRLPLADSERYQTVYAQGKGSVAAPTAGLHFTTELMSRLRERGVSFVFVTLHLALDSFRPVQVDNPLEHVIHGEYGEVTRQAADEISRTRAEGRRVICVGTSTARLLEHVARANEGKIGPFAGWTDLFIAPGHRFQAVDALITNFHLPRSTLLMLVSAFAGRERILQAYQEAIRLGYRFYSFGDAMLII
jgi:S-adenosylmethionine:tRNA ribosyltransferase-isomerase